MPGASARGRTHARQKIGARQGRWSVYLQDEADLPRGTLLFMVAS